MPNLIEERVALARRGANPSVIAKMASGWLVLGDVQPLRGYCVFLADPVVESPNALDEAARVRYSLDVLRAGDALLAVTGAYRINYETLGNSEPSLHTHIIPRYADEPEEKRRDLAFRVYDWGSARKADFAGEDRALMVKLRAFLTRAHPPPPLPGAGGAAARDPGPIERPAPWVRRYAVAIDLRDADASLGRDDRKSGPTQPYCRAGGISP